MVAAWPAVALVGSYELLMVIIRSAQTSALTTRAQDGSAADPLGERAPAMFADELSADRIPSIRAIRAALHVGQSRAQRLRAYLASVAVTDGENLAV